jgi:hypothetical protein
VSIELINSINTKRSQRTIQENISKHLKTNVGELEDSKIEGEQGTSSEEEPDANLLIPKPQINNKLSFKKQNSGFEFQNLFLDEDVPHKIFQEPLSFRRQTKDSNGNINLARKIFQNRLMSRSSSFNIFKNNKQSISPQKRKTKFNRRFSNKVIPRKRVYAEKHGLFEFGGHFTRT